MVPIPSLPAGRRMKLWPGKAGKNDSVATDEERDVDDGVKSVEGEKERAQPVSASAVADTGEESGRPLAKDIKARKQANERLYTCAEAFHSHLAKRKPMPIELSAQMALEVAMTLDEVAEIRSTGVTDSTDLIAQAARDGSASVKSKKEKVLPVEALGIGMASSALVYGTAGRSESDGQQGPTLSKHEAYAWCLSHMAGMHLALADAQSNFAQALSSSMLAKLARTQATIESLRSAEKACEAARQKMDVAEKKRDKAREKGENKRELEEEARLARATYEDAHDDVVSRVTILTETEQSGVNAGVEIMGEYVDQYLDWVNTQRSILTSVQRTLLQNKDARPTGSVRSTISRAAPPIPKRFDVADGENGRRRTTSASPHLAQRPLASTQHSRAASVHTNASRPPSRGSAKSKGAPERPQSAIRSHSFTVESDEKHSNGNAGRTHSNSIGSKISGRLTSVLTRSSSTQDASKPGAGAVQMQASGSSGEGKSSSGWTSSLLTRKRESPSRSYKAMDADENDAFFSSSLKSHQHERDLSHVREGTDEMGTDAGLIAGRDGVRRDSELVETHDTIGPAISHATLNDEDVFAFGAHSQQSRQASDSIPYSTSSPLGLTASDPASSLGVHFTGLTTASSDGGDPFGSSNDHDHSWSAK